MKSVVLLLFALFIMNDAFCQSWLWQQRLNTNSDEDNFNALAVDDFGNVYTAVQFEGPLTVGAFSFQSNPIEDVCLMKMDSTGNVLWALAFGGLYWDQVNGMDCDAEGNVYLAGHFMTSMQIANQTITGSTGRDIFIMRINADGTLGWVQQGSNVWNEEASDLKVDGNGDVIISGAANNTSVIGGMQLYSADPNVFFQGFVAKFSAQGDPIWLQSAGAVEYSSSSYTQTALAVGPDNSIHYTDMRLGGIDFGGIVDPGPGNYNVILLKWSSEGIPLTGWVGLSDFNDFMYDVAVDQQGRIYLAVTTLTSFEFAGQSIQFPAGSYGVCMLRLLPDGSEDAIWPSYSSSDSRIYSIASSPQNEIWFAGYLRNDIQMPFGSFGAYGDQFDRDGLLVRLDANTDTFAGYTCIQGLGWQFIRDVDVNNSGFIYAGADVTGSIDSPVYYGMENQLTDAMEFNALTQPILGRLERLICNTVNLFDYDSLALCSNASIALQVEMPIYTLQWSDGSLLGEYTVTQPDTVGVSVVTQPGCILVDEVEIVAASQPDIDVITSPVTCFGGNDGAANWTWVEGWNYAWNAMPLANLPNELNAGLYTLEVVNTEGCATTIDVLIDEPSAIQVDYGYQWESNEYFTAWVEQITGGLAPYTLQWFDDAGNPVDTLQNVLQDEYTLVVIDGAGCSVQIAVELIGAVEVMSDFEFEVYPNPFDDALTIRASSRLVDAFTLYNCLGEELNKWNTSSITERLSLAYLPAGMYVLTAELSNGYKSSVRLVKRD